MEIENLIQSAKIVEAIRMLTAEVKELQKFGVQLLNIDSCNNSLFELKIPTGKKNALPTMEELNEQRAHEWVYGKGSRQPLESIPEYHILQQKLTQETMLRILQLMLDEKNQAIEMFEMQLSAMGVKF